MSRSHILLTDDEKGITDYLAPILERSGYCVTVAYDGQTALRKVQELQLDLIVLDVLMPGVDGREVCRQLRAAGNWIPVIMLTCVDATMDKVMSLEEGADDYLCKPFDPQELIARIKAVLRRKQSPLTEKLLAEADCLKAGDLLLDRRKRRVEVRHRPVELTPKAMALLEYLMLHAERVFTRDQLMDAVWGWTQPVASRAVDVRIAEVRHALGDDLGNNNYIETVIGLGYQFVAQVKIVNESCD